MKEIVKGAFMEGRNTDTEWKFSESFKIDQKITSDEIRNRKIVQIDPKTNNILNVFEKVGDVVLYFKNEFNKNVSVTNLKYAILASNKFNSYFWGVLNSDAKQGATYKPSEDSKVYAINASGQRYEFSSVGNAGSQLGVYSSQIRNIIKNKDYDALGGFVFVMKKDFNPRIKYHKVFKNPSRIPRNQNFLVTNKQTGDEQVFKTWSGLSKFVGDSVGLNPSSIRTRKSLIMSPTKTRSKTTRAIKDKFSIKVVYRSDV